MGLNREWTKRQGDFFVESPINFLTAIIWYLRKYKDGEFCTLSHVIELMQVDYDSLFTDFRNGVIGPAMLSLATSQIAVTKATNAKALEFAKFELREAIGVTTVLKEMGTQVPPMDANAKATLEKIKSAAKGAAFDKEYIKAQIANHEFLRDLAAGYIKNSTGKTAMPEVHGRHLAMLTLGQFKDHVVLTKDVMQMLG